MKLINPSGKKVTLELDKDEIGMLSNCITQTLEAIEDWELHALIGFTGKELRDIRAKLDEIHDGFPPARE